MTFGILSFYLIEKCCIKKTFENNFEVEKKFQIDFLWLL